MLNAFSVLLWVTTTILLLWVFGELIIGICISIKRNDYDVKKVEIWIPLISLIVLITVHIISDLLLICR